jgi:hypothetical protein
MFSLCNQECNSVVNSCLLADFYCIAAHQQLCNVQMDDRLAAINLFEAKRKAVPNWESPSLGIWGRGWHPLPALSHRLIVQTFEIRGLCNTCTDAIEKTPHGLSSIDNKRFSEQIPRSVS